MIDELGYPKGLLAVEKDLSNLTGSDPSRRIDIVCYTPGTDGLRPLLLIECKAEKSGPEAERQVFGYNEAIRAPFIALASGSEIKTLWRETDRIASVPFLPRFHELLEQLYHLSKIGLRK